MSWEYDERDAVLYNLSLGCKWYDPKFVYYGDENFAPLPTFGVLALHHAGAIDTVDFGSLIPNYNPMLLLHGEHYLELKQPLPRAARLRTETKVSDVIDKGKSALVILQITTTDAETGALVLENEASVILRGSGGFGKNIPKPRKAAAVAPHNRPGRPPDAVISEQTGPEQAALYYLNGDTNPLHLDQVFSNHAGFPRPILQGLCTLGISGKHVLHAFGQDRPEAVQSIKGRFVKHVFPGETLQTEMWLEGGNTVIFQTKVLERGAVAISNAAVVFKEGALSLSKL